MQLFIIPEQYLAEEINALEKHEYFTGTVTQMPSKTVLECEIIANTLMRIGSNLYDKNYQIFPSGLRIYIQKNSLFTYPDLAIYCKPITTYNNRDDVATNPTIINVLPVNTLPFNYSEKLLLYQDLPSLKGYILIFSTKILVEHYVKQSDNKWELSVYKQKDDIITIQSIDFTTAIEVFYENADFSEV